jgi:hypothetical protein
VQDGQCLEPDADGWAELRQSPDAFHELREAFHDAADDSLRYRDLGNEPGGAFHEVWNLFDEVREPFQQVAKRFDELRRAF